ncbi:MAG TPA: hypothetical protein VD864_10700, partial [Nocardioides sp.]|nr:hypothetical protein [Nocardioides sp.]
MSETDRLRDLLERTAPRSPDLTAPERAAAVVRRGRAARRRDQALVGAATLAVLAAALGVPLALSGGDPQEATPAPAPTVAEPCPAAPVDVGTLRPVPTLGDVVAVRSCPVAGEHAEDPLPTQPITDERAAAFAADVAALPEYVMPSMCAVSFVISSPWALQVQTAGGELVMVGGPQRLCSSVRVAGTEVAAEHVVAAFLGNLAGSPATLACPTGDEDVAALPVWNASFDARTAVAGLMCAGSAGTALTAGEVA